MLKNLEITGLIIMHRKSSERILNEVVKSFVLSFFRISGNSMQFRRLCVFDRERSLTTTALSRVLSFYSKMRVWGVYSIESLW
jgi:hypothetical protein